MEIDSEHRAQARIGTDNVLIGANGSGKSNFVSFFKMMSELVNERLQNYIGQAGGADSVSHFGSKMSSRVEAELEFELENGLYLYRFSLVRTASDSLSFEDERLLPVSSGPRTILISVGGHRESQLRRHSEQSEQNAQEIREVLEQCRVFHFHDTSATAKIRSSGYIEANQQLYSDGGNLAAMLYLYQQTRPNIYARIRSAVRKIMPMFDDFVLEPQRLTVGEECPWRGTSPMRHLYVFCEGRTEQEFCKQVLGPHLFPLYHGRITTIWIAHSRHHGKVSRGGVPASYATKRRDIVNTLNSRHEQNEFFTTMIDLYALPRDFPGKDNHNRDPSNPTPYVKALKEAFGDDIADRRFIPHLQLHEYETLLFAKCPHFDAWLNRLEVRLKSTLGIASEPG